MALSTEGVGPKNRGRHVRRNVERGFEYMENSAASQLQQTGAEKQLQLGVFALASTAEAAQKSANE